MWFSMQNGTITMRLKKTVSITFGTTVCVSIWSHSLPLFFIAFLYRAVQHWEQKTLRRRQQQRWYISLVIICPTTEKHDWLINQIFRLINHLLNTICYTEDFYVESKCFSFSSAKWTERNRIRWVNKLHETENFNDKHTHQKCTEKEEENRPRLTANQLIIT